MKDRFFYGFWAGVAAAFFESITAFVFYKFNITDLRFVDFAASFLYGHRPDTMFAAIFAQAAAFFFEGVLGIGFAYLIPLLGSRHYLFKGWVYGVIVWFVVFAFTVILKVPGFASVKPMSVFINFICASIYGIALALATRKMVSDKQVD